MAQPILPAANDPSAAVAIILAAGRGTRMRSSVPKPLLPLAGRPMVQHVLAAAVPAFNRAVVVVGPNMPALTAAVAPHRIALQRDRLGTAHAALQAAPLLAGFRGDAAVLNADIPLVRPETLARLRAGRKEGAHLVLLSMRPTDASGLCRVIACPDTGIVERVVPWDEATVAERAIGLCYGGALCARSVDLFRWLRAVRPHGMAGEMRLTDIVAIAREEGRMVMAVDAPAAELRGIDTPDALAAAEASLQNATHREAA